MSAGLERMTSVEMGPEVNPDPPLAHLHEGIRILSMAELLALPRSQPLVGDIIGREEFTLLWGEPGIGKSFVALDAAVNLAAGQDAATGTTHPVTSNVLYLAGEGGYHIRPRASALLETHGILAHGVKGFGLCPDPISLHVPGDVDRVLRYADTRGLDGVDLVVVDTLAKAAAGMDENSARDVGLVIHSLERFRNEWGAAVLVIHHSTKEGGVERGSSALRGAVDNSIRVQGNVESGVTLSCSKRRNGAPFEPIHLVFAPFEDSLVVSLRSRDPAPPKEDRVVSAVRLLLGADPGGGLRSGDWQAGYIAEGIGSERQFHRDKKAAEEEGLVEASPDPGDGRVTRYSTTDLGRDLAGSDREDV